MARTGRRKQKRADGGYLGSVRRRRTRQAAIFRGEAQAAFDPRVSEWGNPAGRRPATRTLVRGRTRGTETSKYPQEKRTKVIPRVAASERGLAQTVAVEAVAGL